MNSSILFQDQPVIELRQGPARALFAPQFGARLLFWEIDGSRIVHWPTQVDWSKPAKIRGGNPVLFPFIARHFVDGVAEKWRDAQGTIRTMPSHGFCRELPFAVIPEAENTLRMRLRESDSTLAYYPFPFQFDVVYRLTATSLAVEFAVTNTGTEALPYYAGHHFYFALAHPNRSQWKMDLPFTQTGRQNPDGSVTTLPNTETATTLERPEIIDRYLITPTAPSFTLRNQTTQASLRFDLNDPQSVPWYAVTTWTEKPDSDFYCVEPWLGLPNAIHHQQGLRWIAPGQTEKAICGLNWETPPSLG